MWLAFTNFSIKSPTGKKSGRFFLALFLGIFLFLTHPMLCQAGFASATPFADASWEMVAEHPLLGSTGVVQSVCATEDYIICIENYNDLTTDPDVVSAYYKNDTDKDGNPVTQYSLALQVQDADYAHANGMAYNPVTHEILVSGYSSPDASNFGCIFRLDPDTLEQKERVQISDSYNILGIGYLPSTGGYLIQTDTNGGYSFKILDASFQVVDDWGTYPFDFYMENFQDLCVSGDLFFIFPLTMHLGIGNFLQTYSISQKTLLSDDAVDFGFSDDIVSNEPEGLCESNPGEFIAIVGHSGSGKSTFMNMLGCLDTPDSGEYFLDGKDVANLSDNELSDIRNHKIGFIFQGFNLIPNLDALGNVELPLIYRGLGKQQRKEIAGEALSKVGLENRMDHKPNQLSGGQQQRVAVARAIAAQPPIILADEPTGNLDSKSTIEIMNILKDLHKSGRTVIIITHDDEIANQVDRVVRIMDGKIVSDSVNP